MAKESKYSISRNIVFRETFNSYDDVKRNGGNFSTGAIDITDGVCTFTAGQASITYLSPSGRDLQSSFRLRILFHSESINSNYILNSGFCRNDWQFHPCISKTQTWIFQFILPLNHLDFLLSWYFIYRF